MNREKRIGLLSSIFAVIVHSADAWNCCCCRTLKFLLGSTIHANDVSQPAWHHMMCVLVRRWNWISLRVSLSLDREQGRLFLSFEPADKLLYMYSSTSRDGTTRKQKLLMDKRGQWGRKNRRGRMDRRRISLYSDFVFFVIHWSWKRDITSLVTWWCLNICLSVCD